MWRMNGMTKASWLVPKRSDGFTAWLWGNVKVSAGRKKKHNTTSIGRLTIATASMNDWLTDCMPACLTQWTNTNEMSAVANSVFLWLHQGERFQEKYRFSIYWWCSISFIFFLGCCFIIFVALATSDGGYVHDNDTHTHTKWYFSYFFKRK